MVHGSKQDELIGFNSAKQEPPGKISVLLDNTSSAPDAREFSCGLVAV
jgi:hypothetical protein